MLVKQAAEHVQELVWNCLRDADDRHAVYVCVCVCVCGQREWQKHDKCQYKQCCSAWQGTQWPAWLQCCTTYLYYTSVTPTDFWYWKIWICMSTLSEHLLTLQLWRKLVTQWLRFLAHWVRSVPSLQHSVINNKQTADKYAAAKVPTGVSLIWILSWEKLVVMWLVNCLLTAKKLFKSVVPAQLTVSQTMSPVVWYSRV